MVNLSVRNVEIFLLIFFRVIAMVEVAPLLSSSLLPQLAKIGLSFFISFAVFPWVAEMGYNVPQSFVQYFLLVLGEVLIGLMIGFFLAVIYASFQVAGNLFSLQMGFGASQVFDPLAQRHIPLMGQFLNLIAMLIFVSVGGFQKFVLIGVMKSFKALRAVDLVMGREYILRVFIGSLGRLFESALTISFPILGTLLLISVSMGLLAKAAPQMNLLMMGFPVAIGVAFLMLFLTLPFLVDAFARIIDASFTNLSGMITKLGGAAR